MAKTPNNDRFKSMTIRINPELYSDMKVIAIRRKLPLRLCIEEAFDNYARFHTEMIRKREAQEREQPDLNPLYEGSSAAKD